MKILEAMALGTPVVTTTKGNSGLEAEHGVHMLIADQVEDFANAVLRLLSDDDLRTTLAQNARSLIEKKYAWDSILPEFQSLVESIMR